MELAFIVYLISVLSKLEYLMTVVMFLSFVGLFISGFIYIESYDKAAVAAWIKRVFIILVISTGILVVTPSEKTMYTMAGAYAAQQVVQNPEVQKLSGKVLHVIEAKLDSYIEDAASKVDKAAKN